MRIEPMDAESFNQEDYTLTDRLPTHLIGAPNLRSIEGIDN